MTERKPPHLRFEDWAERQVREATERGAFDGLPGAGKPLDDRRLAMTADEWAVRWAQREGADASVFLPPALVLRKERERLIAEVGAMPSEDAVRAVVRGFNDRLVEFYRRPADGPAVVVGGLDAGDLVQRWRDAQVADPGRAAPAPVPPFARTRRSWWRRLLRRR